jgi:hypothetical protein
MIRKFTATILLAAAVPVGASIVAAAPAFAAGSWTCHGTIGSKVDPASSCVTAPAPVTPVEQLNPYWHHHRGLLIALNQR